MIQIIVATLLLQQTDHRCDEVTISNNNNNNQNLVNNRRWVYCCRCCALFVYPLGELQAKMIKNTTYCPPGVHIWDVWVDHGTSQCFMDTISSSLVAGFILIAGSIQLGIYRRYGTEVSPNHLTSNKLYMLQIFITLFLPILEIIRFILQATVFNDRTIYGYMVSMICY